MKRAVFFDAGHTLITLFQEGKRNLFRYLCETHSTTPFDQLDWVRGQIEAERHFQLAVNDPNYLFTEQFWFDRFFVGLFAAGMSYHEATDTAKELAVSNHLEPKNYLLDPDTIATLEELKRRGYLLAVVSNWDGTLKEVFQELGIWSFFDYVADSQVEGFEKPAKQIFQKTLDQLQVLPSEVIHVGDLYYPDVQGAQSLGIDALLFDHLDALGDLFTCQRIIHLHEVLQFTPDLNKTLGA